MRLRLSADLGYRQVGGQPRREGFELLEELTLACDAVLTKHGYNPNRLVEGEIFARPDTTSIEVEYGS